MHAHDYFVSHWSERELPVETDLLAALDSGPDVIAITAGHSQYRSNSILSDWLAASAPRIVFDTIGLLSDSEISELSAEHRVLVLGRGGIDSTAKAVTTS